jgi:hypothetical protein
MMQQHKLFTGIYIGGTAISLALAMTLFMMFHLKLSPAYPEYERNRTLNFSGVDFTDFEPKTHDNIVKFLGTNLSGYFASEKIVEIDVADASLYAIGEQVEVALQSRSMGTKSVVLAYVVPFLVLTLLMVGALAVGLSEGVAVLAGIGGIALYYFVLYFMQNRVKNIIKFIIIKQTK